MEVYASEIRMYAGSVIPQGWHLCDGSLLNINEYNELFTILGTTYGGDGITTFGIPDLRGRMVVGSGTDVDGTIYTTGNYGGSESVVLSEEHTPAHNHKVMASTTPAVDEMPSSQIWAIATLNTYKVTEPNVTLHPSSISESSGGNGHENCQPSIAINYMIALSSTI